MAVCGLICERLPTTRIGAAGGSHVNLRPLGSPVPKCADARRTPVQKPLGRRGHHPQQRLMLDHESDIDRELAIALDEFAGSIEGIDHPQFAPLPAFGPLGLRRLFGQDGYVRPQPPQAVVDDPLRLQIRQSQGRVVELVLHRESAVVDRHDRGTGVRNDGQQRLGNVGKISHPLI